MQPATTFFLLLTAVTIDFAYGQSVHVVSLYTDSSLKYSWNLVFQVNVGDSGSFYDPQIVAASRGDIISFRFIGQPHSVSQSTFAAPCDLLPGGFDSDVAGNPPQTVAPTAEWNLTITDDTQPIWYYCKLITPRSHCIAGMVGAINVVPAGTNQSFDLFLQRAKNLTSVPPPPSGVSTLGIGAFATTKPMPRNGTNTTTSTTAAPGSTTTTSSSVSTTSQPPASSTSNSKALATDQIGGIAGGIVGGLIVIILLFLLFLSHRRGRRLRKEAALNKSIHHSNSSRDMSHLGRSDLLYGGDVRRVHDAGPILQQFPRSQAAPSVSESLDQESTSGPSTKELAAEIVKYMRQEQPNTGERGRQTQDLVGLPPLPERQEASSGAESTRSAGGRQLPRPPPSAYVSRPTDDTSSVDTLPAYVAGKARMVT